MLLLLFVFRQRVKDFKSPLTCVFISSLELSYKLIFLGNTWIVSVLPMILSIYVLCKIFIFNDTILLIVALNRGNVDSALFVHRDSAMISSISDRDVCAVNRVLN